MNCRAFETWLDEGMPAAQDAEAARHAGACARCAAALETARAIEGLLAAGPARAPADFTDRVMARVAAPDEAPAIAGARARALGRALPEAAFATPALAEAAFATPALPWWVRAAADPACAAALALAGLLVWRGDALLASARAAASALGSAIAGALLEASAGSALLASQTLRLGLVIAALPGVLWFAYVAFRWAERLAQHAGGRTIRPAGR